jgi:hypothetical protein
MIRLNVSKKSLCADGKTRYCHLFACEFDLPFYARKAFDELSSRFEEPEYMITITRWESSGTVISREILEHL